VTGGAGSALIFNVTHGSQAKTMGGTKRPQWFGGPKKLDRVLYSGPPFLSRKRILVRRLVLLVVKERLQTFKIRCVLLRVCPGQVDFVQQISFVFRQSVVNGDLVGLRLASIRTRKRYKDAKGAAQRRKSNKSDFHLGDSFHFG